MLARIINKVRYYQNMLSSRVHFNYIKNRTSFQFAPYSISIYRDLLTQVHEKELAVLQPFTRLEGEQDATNLYVRHDIDTQQCIDNMPFMLDIDLELGIQSGVYFMVSDDIYRLRDYRDIIQRYKDAGLEMGLHTQCYIKDDYLTEFKRETEGFAEATGFYPKSFSIHGLGNYRADTRRKFRKEIASTLKTYGYTFTDCDKSWRKYYYRIEDCHATKDKKRFIYQDFAEFPPHFGPSKNILLLTHPCYWKK